MRGKGKRRPSNLKVRYAPEIVPDVEHGIESASYVFIGKPPIIFWKIRVQRQVIEFRKSEIKFVVESY